MKFKIAKHFILVSKHRFQVFKLCFKCGIWYRGLVHDLSKFSFSEFFESAKYYCGNHSPIVEARKDKGYSRAWLHHKGRNKHHLEYWYDFDNKVQTIIPYKYLVECVCDKIAASKCYNPKDYKPEYALNHWLKYGQLVPSNEKNKQFITRVFTDLVEKGEKAILNKKYLKSIYNEIMFSDDLKKEMV